MLFLVAAVKSESSLFLRTFTTSAAASVKKKMPPKKAAAPEKKVILGSKNTNNLSMGFVGVSGSWSLSKKSSTWKIIAY